MPEQVQPQDAHIDPSVAKQWDTETPFSQQWSDLYRIVDGLKCGLLGTHRPNVGHVFRSMAIAKRNGPDFLFLANANSQKFKDIDSSKDITITFQNSSTMDWVSISGTATTASHDDPRIKDVWSRGASAWFGNLGDGKHDGSADDPRMALIEVKSKYIAYWKAEVGTLGLIKEVAGAAMTGKVANTGAMRQFEEKDIQAERKE
ncbi:hypothetical protein K402DRAFT_403326 [Aulographum hederae CBS 113979]|uniref:General stress protein FMN-binding split barrel domain-containing protein n=1 Tax=Aulographum hederae CBS 113979 TaxID=1176131 RepID=A0A6G1H3T7_9PEZI|nr:hypothetical protein K402DRAFT_403326 [Aulographum hederae CBS 113979]